MSISQIHLWDVQAVPDETKPHFTLATEGLAFSSGAGAYILYHTHDCLRLNQTNCLRKGHPYHEVSAIVRLCSCWQI